MTVNRQHVRQYLRNFDFENLFVEELGWDRGNKIAPVTVTVDEQPYSLRAVAEKRSVVVFLCLVNGDIPLHATRRKIDRQVAEKYREHFIIFADGDHTGDHAVGRVSDRRVGDRAGTAPTRQVWQWVRREPGRPMVSRSHEYRISQPGDALAEKLERMAFDWADEETLNVVEVSGRLRAAFNVEPATRRFYDTFKNERTAFERFIAGIERLESKREYVSVMLNRLMFIYFIQKKGFLDGDTDYLRNRMRRTRERFGHDQFYSFYRYFLLRLFHEGLGSFAREAELESLIGNVPYLNGGLFELHQIERENPNILIPDAAFEQVLGFFDRYQWHLDDRPLRADNEINPDVLGYIFEKYINQKQMGAYYTKEDITDYIGKNTIIPYLFDAARKIYPPAFEGEHALWKLLQDDPNRYIYPAMQKGVDLPLPEELTAGIEDVSRRGGWNVPAPEEYALPTEIWRETVARRQRYEEVWYKLVGGEVTEINDLITLNLDIRQFAQDGIENCEQPDTLRAFWKALRGMTILDPTAGSGAFLFAALNILQPLYEACLERMDMFVKELPPEAPAHKFKDFKDTLANVARHPNADYFILKSIIVDNLYGVDIMAEAVEIAKLRLFLKLAAQVEPDATKKNWGIEPLPDIDFNIRAGNTLVGFATRAEVVRGLQGALGTDAQRYGEQGAMGFAQQESQMKMLFTEESTAFRRIEEKAEEIDRLYTLFRHMQTGEEMGAYAQDFAETKAKLRQRLDDLGEELNRALAKQYGINPDEATAYATWRDNHQPFHWFIEFYGIMKEGGFSVVIGNPPYVKYDNQIEYEVKGFETFDCKDLYAYIMEVSVNLLSASGLFGMIIPVSSVSTDGFVYLRTFLTRNLGSSWITNFAERPSKLFTGVEKRLTIWIGSKSQKPHPQIHLSKYYRWFSNERDTLFWLLRYVKAVREPSLVTTAIPKIYNPIETAILKKMRTHRPIGLFSIRTGNHAVLYTRKLRYFVQFFDFVPKITNEKAVVIEPSELKRLPFPSEQFKNATIAVLNSSLFFWFLSIHSDVRNVNKREIEAFPCSLDTFKPDLLETLSRITNELMEDFQKNSRIITNNYGKYGVLNIQSFQPRESKPIIDKIDQLLAGYYGLTTEELDFIINYDIKYRMGDALGEDGEGEEEE